MLIKLSLIYWDSMCDNWETYRSGFGTFGFGSQQGF